MISQKDGVYNAVVAFCEDSGIEFEDGMKMEFGKDARASIVEMLVGATEAGELEVKSAAAQANLSSYWNGTLSNWLRKDKRLNGNTKHVIKDPGSRAGVGDPELKELKKLLIQVTATGNEEHIAAVNDAIEGRKTILAASKVKDVEVDFEKIPEALRHLVG